MRKLQIAPIFLACILISMAPSVLFAADSFSESTSRFPDDELDGDGLSNAVEAEAGTDPMVADTDGDSLEDGEEAVPTNGTMKVAAAPEASYAIIDLGLQSEVGSARGINDDGTVLLVKWTTSKRWSGGAITPVSDNAVVWGPLKMERSITKKAKLRCLLMLPLMTTSY